MIYLFDIDGTLTLPRQKISVDFEEFFYNWMKDKKVFFVTGSDLSKVKEQLSERILDRCNGIFCSMANELYINGELKYKNSLRIPEALYSWLEQYLEASEYHTKTGKHFENRSGMLNFSIVGRNATDQQREDYFKWDLKKLERKSIADFINNKFGKDYEACIGGQISIDIQAKGKNKKQASKWIRENIHETMHFFGDRCEAGGNDFDIVNDLSINKDGIWTNVIDPNHIKNVLETLQ